MNKHLSLADLQAEKAFRFATAADVPALLELYGLFYKEAAYKDMLDYDEQRVAATILDGILNDVRPHIVAELDESLVGFISYWLDHTFSKQPCLVLMELYVHPDFRRGAIGRALVGLAIQEGINAKAGAFHAPISSGMGEARSLFNLFLKAGFEPFGVIMRRKL